MTLGEVRQAAADRDLPRFVEALVAFAQIEGYWGTRYNELREAVKFDKLPFRVPAAVALSDRLPSIEGENARSLLEYVIEYMLTGDSRQLGAEDAWAVLAITAKHWEFHGYAEMEVLGRTVLKAGRVLTPEMVAVMRRTAAVPGNKPLKEFVAGLKQPPLNLGEPWADQALADLSTLEDGWQALVAHAAAVTEDAPSPKWEKEAGKLLAVVGPQRAREVILGWLALVGRPRTLALIDRAGGDIAYRPDRYNSRVMRALVWLLGLLPTDSAQARQLADLAEASLRKVPGMGPRNRLVAEGAIYALSRVEGTEGLAQLVRLVPRVSHQSAASDIDLALKDKAQALQATREQLMDFAVPSFGLTEVGLRVQRFGDDIGFLRADGAAVTLQWRNSTGLTLTSPPTAVKQGFPEQLKEFRESARELGKTLTALTAALARPQTWRYGPWRALVLDHVVVGALARKHLWRIDGQLYGYTEGELRAVAPLTEKGMREGAPCRANAQAVVQLSRPEQARGA